MGARWCWVAEAPSHRLTPGLRLGAVFSAITYRAGCLSGQKVRPPVRGGIRSRRTEDHQIARVARRHIGRQRARTAVRGPRCVQTHALKGPRVLDTQRAPSLKSPLYRRELRVLPGNPFLFVKPLRIHFNKTKIELKGCGLPFCHSDSLIKIKKEESVEVVQQILLSLFKLRNQNDRKGFLD